MLCEGWLCEKGKTWFSAAVHTKPTTTCIIVYLHKLSEASVGSVYEQLQEVSGNIVRILGRLTVSRTTHGELDIIPAVLSFPAVLLVLPGDYNLWMEGVNSREHNY